jgi:hypothetical protein
MFLGLVVHNCNPSYKVGLWFKASLGKKKLSRFYLKKQARHGGMYL